MTSDLATRPDHRREDLVHAGRENLVLVARLRHLTGARRLADELLARFALTDAAGRRVSTYSGRRRVS